MGTWRDAFPESAVGRESEEIEEGVGEGVEAGGGDAAGRGRGNAGGVESEDVHAGGEACFKAWVAVFDDGALGGVDVQGFGGFKEDGGVRLPFVDVVCAEDEVFGEVREETGDAEGEFDFFAGAGGGDADGDAVVEGMDEIVCAVDGLEMGFESLGHGGAEVGGEGIGELAVVFGFDVGEHVCEFFAAEAFDVVCDDHACFTEAVDEDDGAECFAVDECAVAIEDDGFDFVHGRVWVWGIGSG